MKKYLFFYTILITALVISLISFSCSAEAQTVEEPEINYGIFGTIDGTVDSSILSRHQYNKDDWGEAVSDYYIDYQKTILSGRNSPLGSFDIFKSYGVYSFSAKSQFTDNTNDGYFSVKVDATDINLNRFEISSLESIYKPTVTTDAYRIIVDKTVNLEFTQRMPQITSRGALFDVTLIKVIPIKKLTGILKVDKTVYDSYSTDQKFIWNNEYFVGTTLNYLYLKNLRLTVIAESVRNEDTPSISNISFSPKDSVTPTINVSFGTYSMDQSIKTIYVNNTAFDGTWIDSSNLSYTVTQALVSGVEIWVDIPEKHKTVANEYLAAPYSKTYNSVSTGTTTTINPAIAVEITIDADYTDSTLDVNGEIDYFYFNTIKDTTYDITWQDKLEQLTQDYYSCNIKVSAYREDSNTPYFENINNGYTTPQTITALESENIYIKVESQSITNNSTGTYALKVTLTP